MEQKNAAAAVGGEGKDYCSNLVFTKKWDQDLKKNLYNTWVRIPIK